MTSHLETTERASSKLVVPDEPFVAGDERHGLERVVGALEIGEEYLWQPDRLVPFEHWVGHIPFAFWLIKALRPRRFVELGTHRGNSYCAMCQAVATLGLESAGCAIDTWQGDVHMAPEEELLDDLRAYHDPRYGAFSTLIPATFDAARVGFDDWSIDLLHIDGTHTYEAARHDFENWLPILSERGVVILHDVNVHQENFGVWRFWEEARRRYPSFEFPHSHGLGVLGVGEQQPDLLRRLFAATSEPDLAAQVQTLFATRGGALVDRLRLSLAERENIEASQREMALRGQLTAELAATKDRLDEAGTRTAEQEARHRAQAAEIAMLVAISERETRLRAQIAAQLATATATAQREIALRARATEELKAMRIEAGHSEKVAEHHRQAAGAAAARLAAIENSTMWQALYPVRRLLHRVPTDVRRFGRRSLRLAWWTVTLQLPRRLRTMR